MKTLKFFTSDSNLMPPTGFISKSQRENKIKYSKVKQDKIDY